MKKNKSAIHIRLPEEIKNKLDRLAEMDRRTLSDYCRIILEDRVNPETEKAKVN